ncbi:MAG: ABC transporter ATP-binding protein [Clostridia bacterium]|nr:ABC transporter ATP-binding protein [Clostridia bacterium]
MRRLEKEKYRKKPESEYVTEMQDDNNILEVENLHSYFFTDQGVVKAVNGATFNIPLNSTVGVVGESGCGKSVTSMSIMRLLQGPTGQIVEGSIRFKAYDFKRDEKGDYIPVYERDENGEIVYEQKLDKKGKPVLDKAGNPVMIPKQKTDEHGLGIFEKEEKVFDIAKMPIDEMYRLRGRQMSMVFQEPMTSLNPVFTIGDQLDEVTLLHVPGATKELAKKRSIEMLNMVGIAMPERVYASFPHELSGGMRQRVMIAMALAGEPRLIIADEPTTALDVTIQAQILDLFNDLKHRINGSILLITHDLGVIAEMADYVIVMYAGRIIEQGTASEIFHNPCHPYTQGLQKSKPTMKSSTDKLFNIPGNVPNPVNMPNYCYFKERCSKCVEKCSGDYPCMVQVSPTHFVACHLYEEENPVEVKTDGEV